MIRKGDVVTIKAQWQDKGDDEYVWVAMSDEEKGRVDISPVDHPVPFVSTVVVDMLEHGAVMAITAERVRLQYAKNAASLRDMLVKARAIAPKKYRSYTVAQLEEMVWCYEHMAAGLPMPEQAIDVKAGLMAYPLRGERLAAFQRDYANGWR